LAAFVGESDPSDPDRATLGRQLAGEEQFADEERFRDAQLLRSSRLANRQDWITASLSKPTLLALVSGAATLRDGLPVEDDARDTFAPLVFVWVVVHLYATLPPSEINRLGRR
jgi:hypothetical protein